MKNRGVFLRGREVTALQEPRLMFQVSGMLQNTAAFGYKGSLYYSAQHYLSKINMLFFQDLKWI